MTAFLRDLSRALLVWGVGWATAGLVAPLRRARGKAAVVLATRVEGAVFLTALGAYAVLSMFVPRLHDLIQIQIYVLLLLAGVRVVRGAQSSGTSC